MTSYFWTNWTNRDVCERTDIYHWSELELNWNNMFVNRFWHCVWWRNLHIIRKRTAISGSRTNWTTFLELFKTNSDNSFTCTYWHNNNLQKKSVKKSELLRFRRVTGMNKKKKANNQHLTARVYLKHRIMGLKENKKGEVTFLIFKILCWISA